MLKRITALLCIAATGLVACKGHSDSDRNPATGEHLKDRHYFFPNNSHTLEISNPDGTAEVASSKERCREREAAQEATIYDNGRESFVNPKREITEMGDSGGRETAYKPTPASKTVEVIVTPPINGKPQLWINRNKVPYDRDGSFEVREINYFKNPKTGEPMPAYIQSVVYTVKPVREGEGEGKGKRILVCPTSLICPEDENYLCAPQP